MPATAGTRTKKPLQKRPSPNAVLAKMLEYLAEGEYDHQLTFLQGEVHGRMRTKREAKTRQADRKSVV